ncbi:MAG: hypothetical protein CW691_06290 [Candidatus Bathyarchaeum sp.]|nr:MAG: hypothetical protein CW691_06290 [Candidatus Bathyarchaeum sp.]
MSAKSAKSNNGTKSLPLTRESLVKLKHKALRRGIWFRALKHKERTLLELTIRVVEKVHSFLLARILSQILSKLCEAMESRIFRLMKTEGRIMAEKISKTADAWGNRSAKSWATDQGFMQYLTVNNLQSFNN